MAPARLTWTRQSQRGVQRIFDFLAIKNEAAARRAVAVIRRDVQKLTAFPQAGRPVPERGPEYRELLVPFGDGGYSVLYFYAAHEIEVLAVRHQREAGY